VVAQPCQGRIGHRIRRTTRRFLPHRRQQPGDPGVSGHRRHPGHGDGARVGRCEEPRQIWWLHTTQSAATHAFATEVTALLESLPDARQHVFYTVGDDTVAPKRLDAQSINALGLPTDATA
jgi:hypothetical protein